jgi:hypothetical protein
MTIVSTFLATRTSRNTSTIGTFQKRPAEVATVYKEMKSDEEAATAGGGYDGGYSTVSPVHPVKLRVPLQATVSSTYATTPSK